MELYELSAKELNHKLRQEEVSISEVVEHFQKRIKDLNPKINAFLSMDKQQGASLDPNSSAIAGVPFGVKDVLTIQGHPAGAASKVLKGYIAPYTATVVNKLLASDAVALGRTNCDEFAMGTSTENSAYGPTRNPWDLECVPGGSSGGSAAAVAARMVPFALGTDTGGSTRQPASFCGVVGVKPTYGRVSRYGLLSLASSFDTIGCFTRTVEDAANVMKVISGSDSMDATAVNVAVPNYIEFLEKGVKGLRIGIPKEYFIEGISPETEKAIRGAIKQLETMGAELKEVSLPNSTYGIAAYYIILPVEVSANLSRYDGIKYGYRSDTAKSLQDIYQFSRGEGFGDEPKRRIMLGTYASSSGYYDAYYKQALRARLAIKADFKKVFEEVDVLATPTSPVSAFKLGEKSSNPLELYLADIFTVGANISGIPGISLPCGLDNNLPVGLQIMAPWFREELLFQTAGAYEEATEWHKSAPLI